MYVLGHYPAKGKLITTNATVELDPYSGYVYFNGLVIDMPGMYMLSARINSAGNEFTSQCYSNVVTVSQSLENSTSSSSSNTPNYKLKFKGNYSSLSTSDKNQMKASVYNYISSFNLNVENIQITDADGRKRRDTSSGTVIVAFYSSGSSASLISLLPSMNISEYVIYSSATINGVTYGSTSSSDSSSSALISSASAGLIVGIVLGIFFLAVFLMIGYYFIHKIRESIFI